MTTQHWFSYERAGNSLYRKLPFSTNPVIHCRSRRISIDMYTWINHALNIRSTLFFLESNCSNKQLGNNVSVLYYGSTEVLCLIFLDHFFKHILAYQKIIHNIYHTLFTMYINLWECFFFFAEQQINKKQNKIYLGLVKRIA